MFEKVFISDPNFQYTQYFTFENFLLLLYVCIAISFLIFLITDFLNR